MRLTRTNDQGSIVLQVFIKREHENDFTFPTNTLLATCSKLSDITTKPLMAFWRLTKLDLITDNNLWWIRKKWRFIQWYWMILLKPDLHTPTLTANFWNAPSKLRQKIASMQWLLRFWKICELVTDFGPIFAWILLEILKILSRPTKLACVTSA